MTTIKILYEESIANKYVAEWNNTKIVIQNQANEISCLRKAISQLNDANTKLGQSVHNLADQSNTKITALQKQYDISLKIIEAKYIAKMQKHQTEETAMLARITDLEKELTKVIINSSQEMNEVKSQLEEKIKACAAYQEMVIYNQQINKNQETNNSIQNTLINSKEICNDTMEKYEILQNQYISLQNKYMDKESQIDKIATIRSPKTQRKAIKFTYTAETTDDIDVKVGEFMSEYLKTYSLDIPLIRISKGVYLFGTQRLLLSIDNGGKFRVRIGGGYMTLYDFLKYHNEIEYIKSKNSMYSRNAVQIFKSNSVKLQPSKK